MLKTKNQKNHYTYVVIINLFAREDIEVNFKSVLKYFLNANFENNIVL